MAARYQQIAQELREAIRQGTYAIGTLLPSEGELAAQYSVSRGTVRQAVADDEPVMLERSFFPGSVAEHILAMDLTTGSITEQLTALGFVHAHGDHLIDAVSATTLEARLLGVRRGSPLLRQRWLASSPTGQPLAWSEDSYRHDAVIISVRQSMSANNLARLSGRGTPAARG